MPQYQAVKDLRHDGKIVYAGSVVPQAWVDEWDGYGNNTIGKMRRNNQIQLIPEGSEPLPEAEPVVLNVGDSMSTSMSANERAAVTSLLDKMPEREALQYVRDNDMVPDLGAPTEVDPLAVNVAEQWQNDDSEFDPDNEAAYFNPAEHNIEEVKQFVSENPETAGDVLDAEAAGKNRSTLVKWLEETLEAQDTDDPEPVDPDDPDDDEDDDNV